jgi:hypothetical protein
MRKPAYVRAAFEQSEPLSSFYPALFKRTAQKVRLDVGGKVALILKNDQIIGKGDDHADEDNASTADDTAANRPTA